MNIQYIYTLFKLITWYRAIKWYRVADNLSRYLRVIIGPSIWRPSIRWYREKNGTIDDGSRIRRLYTLSLSTIVHFGIPWSYLEYISTYHNNRTDGSMEQSVEQSVTRRWIDRGRRNIPENEYRPPRIGANRVETGTTGLAYLGTEPDIVTISGLRGENDL